MAVATTLLARSAKEEAGGTRMQSVSTFLQDGITFFARKERSGRTIEPQELGRVQEGGCTGRETCCCQWAVAIALGESRQVGHEFDRGHLAERRAVRIQRLRLVQYQRASSSRPSRCSASLRSSRRPALRFGDDGVSLNFLVDGRRPLHD